MNSHGLPKAGAAGALACPGAPPVGGEESRLVSVLMRGLEHFGYRHFRGTLRSQAAGLGHLPCSQVDTMGQADMAAVMQRLMQAANAALSVGTCERPSTPADGTASNSRAAVHGDTKLDAGPALQPTKQQRKSGQPTQEDVDQHESLADGHDASRGQHGDAAAATVTSPDLPTPAQPLLQQHTRYAANSVQEANGASTFPPPSVRPSTLMLVADAYNQHTTSTVPAALKADAARPTLSSHPGRSMLTRTPITPFSSAPAQPQSPTQAAEGAGVALRPLRCSACPATPSNTVTVIGSGGIGGTDGEGPTEEFEDQGKVSRTSSLGGPAVEEVAYTPTAGLEDNGALSTFVSPRSTAPTPRSFRRSSGSSRPSKQLKTAISASAAGTVVDEVEDCGVPADAAASAAVIKCAGPAETVQADVGALKVGAADSHDAADGAGQTLFDILSDEDDDEMIVLADDDDSDLVAAAAVAAAAQYRRTPPDNGLVARAAADQQRRPSGERAKRSRDRSPVPKRRSPVPKLNTRPNHQSTVDDGSSGGAMDRRLPSQDNNLGSRSRSHEDELIAGSNWKRRSGSRDPDQDLDRDRDYNEERRMGQKRFRGESHRETHAADGRGIDRQRDTQERGRGRDRDAEGIRERDRRRGRDERLARLGTGDGRKSSLAAAARAGVPAPFPAQAHPGPLPHPGPSPISSMTATKPRVVDPAALRAAAAQRLAALKPDLAAHTPLRGSQSRQTVHTTRTPASAARPVSGLQDLAPALASPLDHARSWSPPDQQLLDTVGLPQPPSVPPRTARPHSSSRPPHHNPTAADVSRYSPGSPPRYPTEAMKWTPLSGLRPASVLPPPPTLPPPPPPPPPTAATKQTPPPHHDYRREMLQADQVRARRGSRDRRDLRKGREHKRDLDWERNQGREREREQEVQRGRDEHRQQSPERSHVLEGTLPPLTLLVPPVTLPAPPPSGARRHERQTHQSGGEADQHASARPASSHSAGSSRAREAQRLSQTSGASPAQPMSPQEAALDVRNSGGDRHHLALPHPPKPASRHGAPKAVEPATKRSAPTSGVDPLLAAVLQDGADHSDDAVVAADILRDRRTRDRQRTSAASAAAWLLLEGAQAAMKADTRRVRGKGMSPEPNPEHNVRHAATEGPALLSWRKREAKVASKVSAASIEAKDSSSVVDAALAVMFGKETAADVVSHPPPLYVSLPPAPALAAAAAHRATESTGDGKHMRAIETLPIQSDAVHPRRSPQRDQLINTVDAEGSGLPQVGSDVKRRQQLSQKDQKAATRSPSPVRKLRESPPAVQQHRDGKRKGFPPLSKQAPPHGSAPSSFEAAPPGKAPAVPEAQVPPPERQPESASPLQQAPSAHSTEKAKKRLPSRASTDAPKVGDAAHVATTDCEPDVGTAVVSAVPVLKSRLVRPGVKPATDVDRGPSRTVPAPAAAADVSAAAERSAPMAISGKTPTQATVAAAERPPGPGETPLKPPPADVHRQQPSRKRALPLDAPPAQPRTHHRIAAPVAALVLPASAAGKDPAMINSGAPNGVAPVGGESMRGSRLMAQPLPNGDLRHRLRTKAGGEDVGRPSPSPPALAGRLSGRLSPEARNLPPTDARFLLTQAAATHLHQHQQQNQYQQQLQKHKTHASKLQRDIPTHKNVPAHRDISRQPQKVLLRIAGNADGAAGRGAGKRAATSVQQGPPQQGGRIQKRMRRGPAGSHQGGQAPKTVFGKKQGP